MKRKEYTAVNFSNADFSKPLCGFTFTDCSFVDADIRETKIENCMFIDCDMRGADLSLSIIKNTVFTSDVEYSLDLLGANIEYADIIDSKFRRCNMAGVNLRASRIYNTELYSVRLKDAKLTSARFKDSIVEDSYYSGPLDFVLIDAEWIDGEMKKGE